MTQFAIAAEIEDEYAELQQRAERLIPKDAEVTSTLAQPMGVTVRNGDVIVYHTTEHDARIVPLGDALRAALKKKLPNGQRAFSARPTGEMVRGEVKCYLHPDHPDRQKWYDLGITIMCQSGHFATVVDMEQQMQSKHSREWLRMKTLMEREERDEERTFQRQMLRAIQPQQPQVSEWTTTGTPMATVTLDEPVIADSGSYICPNCSKVFITEKGRTFHVNRWCKG